MCRNFNFLSFLAMLCCTVLLEDLGWTDPKVQGVRHGVFMFSLT
jgi:hypothetical protein